ncbi:MAG: phosphoribosyltransferase [Verrucomicrobia bacterium]|nr:phosphoribosyltransferase [Verrucomicrobiota bacterium]
MSFEDRYSAGLLLGEELRERISAGAIILGIPRGGVSVAAAVAKLLDCELDLILVHKLGFPGQPEVAMGAVDESGNVFLNEYASELRVTEGYIEREAARQKENLLRQRALYTPGRVGPELRDRIVVAVDDGWATGSTMVSALRAIRARKPSRLIAATPVSSSNAYDFLSTEADEVVCLEVPADFRAVGMHYEDFSQVSDDTVVKLLR